MNKPNGFTFIEVLIALGISSVTLMAAIFVLNFFWTKSNSLQSQVSTHLDLSILEKFLFKDLNSAQFSLGNIILTEPGTAVNFFDLYSQTPISLIPTSLQTRSYALDASNGGGSIEFIVTLDRSQDSINGGLTNYFSPSDAYSVGPLTFVGINQKGFFNNHYPTLFSGGNHFLFYSPAAIISNCNLNFCPSYYYAIMGFESGSQFEIDSLDGNFNHRHPLYPAVSVPITDIDKWFRYCPTIGGADCTVLVTPVNVVRYHLVPDGLGSGNLYRAIKTGNSYQTETLIAKDINRITFLRPDVTNALIQFSLVLKR